MKPSLSVIILTYNEEVNLPRALESVQGLASDVFVVDSGSTDRTAAIAKDYGAHVYEHEFVNQAQQFNWALDNLPVKTEWILRLDADEYLTPELVSEIERKLPSVPAEVNAFLMKRRVYFMGRWIRHGGYYPTWFLRLFRTGKAHSENREMDEHLIVKDGEIGRLENDFADDNRKNLESWIAKHNNFSTREARSRLREALGEKAEHVGHAQADAKRWLKQNFYGQMPLFWRSFAYFIYRYIFRLGFLDGKEGLIFHFMQGCWHQFTIDAKLYEAGRRN